MRTPPAILKRLSKIHAFHEPKRPLPAENVLAPKYVYLTSADS